MKRERALTILSIFFFVFGGCGILMLFYLAATNEINYLSYSSNLIGMICSNNLEIFVVLFILSMVIGLLIPLFSLCISDTTKKKNNTHDIHSTKINKKNT